MTLFKRRAVVCLAICITAILGIAVSGCDDLGAYDSTEEYYDSFGNVIFKGGIAEEGTDYPVEDYFYNNESRENFLEDENGKYMGVEHSDYVYVAIPFNKSIQMDSLAMYLQAKTDVTVYINVYVVNEEQIPTNWKKTEGSETLGNKPMKAADASLEDKLNETSAAVPVGNTEDDGQYDDPDPKTRIGEIALFLKAEEWNSFILDSFKVSGKTENSIYVNDGQYILLQIRNNSGVRVWNDDSGLWVDEQSGLVLERAEITMTNLLVRALDLETETETKGGDE